MRRILLPLTAVLVATALASPASGTVGATRTVAAGSLRVVSGAVSGTLDSTAVRD